MRSAGEPTTSSTTAAPSSRRATRSKRSGPRCRVAEESLPTAWGGQEGALHDPFRSQIFESRSHRRRPPQTPLRCARPGEERAGVHAHSTLAGPRSAGGLAPRRDRAPARSRRRAAPAPAPTRHACGVAKMASISRCTRDCCSPSTNCSSTSSGLPSCVAQRRPELRLERADAVETAALARVHAVARVAAAQPLRAALDLLPAAQLRESQRQPGRCAVGHRHVQPACRRPRAGPRPGLPGSRPPLADRHLLCRQPAPTAAPAAHRPRR